MRRPRGDATPVRRTAARVAMRRPRGDAPPRPSHTALPRSPALPTQPSQTAPLTPRRPTDRPSLGPGPAGR